MASGGEDKTEAPTPKRLREARERGELPMSHELGTAFGLLGLFGVLAFCGPVLLNAYKDLLRDGILTAGTTHELSINGVMYLILDMVQRCVLLIGVPALAVGTIGITLGFIQTQFNFSLQALKPSFSKLNPINGIKRIFGVRGIFEVVKEIIKIVIIGGMCFWVLWPRRDELGKTVGMPPADMLPYLAHMALLLGFAVSAAYVVLAIADYLFQRWQTMRDMKMTKEEVKQEARQTDMSPEMKQAIKQQQRSASQRRMMSQIPEADVVITNPTHFAVALKYENDQPAPKVIAKGQDLIAARIRQAAQEHGVELVENPPLARSLYQACEPGDWIPEELFMAVAEVLAYVYRKRDEMED